MATFLEIWHSKCIIGTCWYKSVLIHKSDIIRRSLFFVPTVLVRTHEFFQNILRTYDMYGSTVATEKQKSEQITYPSVMIYAMNISNGCNPFKFNFSKVKIHMQVRKQWLELDMEQIGKGVRQGCILSPCLFNLYAEYIMRNTGLEEAQAGIKIPILIGINQDCQKKYR